MRERIWKILTAIVLIAFPVELVWCLAVWQYPARGGYAFAALILTGLIALACALHDNEEEK